MLPRKQKKGREQQKTALQEYKKHTAMEQIGTLLQRRQYTRKDLNIDQDSIEDPNMSYDFLDGKTPSTSLGNALENLSVSGSSQSSSTVIRNSDMPNPVTKEQLKSIPLGTLEMDAQFRKKLHVALTSARENRTTSTSKPANKKTRSSAPSDMRAELFSPNRKEKQKTEHKDLNYQSGTRTKHQQSTMNNNSNIRTAQQTQQKQDIYRGMSQEFDRKIVTENNERKDEEVVVATAAAVEEDEDDFSDQLLTDYTEGLLPSPPASPPRELDPQKLYALYDFSGPDSSQVELLKDDAVQLLNDSDSFWWLVKRSDDGTVGFAPAEILETYEERLARLNCWKNEVLERGKENSHLSREDLKLLDYNSIDHRVPSVNLVNNSDGTNGGNKNMSSSLGSIPSSLTSYNSSSMQSLRSYKEHSRSGGATSLGRKSSLKRGKSTHKKSVTFAGSLPQLTEESNELEPRNIMGDDEDKEVVAKHVEASIPLVVPKRACRTNFLINDLDEYDRVQQESNPPSAPFINGAGSIGSYSPSTNSDYSDGWGNDELKAKEMEVVKEHGTSSKPNKGNTGINNDGDESRFTTLNKLSGNDDRSTGESDTRRKRAISLSQSIQMLDDLIENSPEFSSQRLQDKGNKFIDAEFVPPEIGDSDMKSRRKTAPGIMKRYKSEDSSYNSNRKVKDTKRPQRAVSDSASISKLHPVTSEIFNPLMSHMEELEKMMKDIYIDNSSTHE